jgi:hypothetical protein
MQNFMLKSKAKKIRDGIPEKFRPIIKELEDVTFTGQTEEERTQAYIGIMAKMEPKEREELSRVLARTRAAIQKEQGPKVGNRAQRRAASRKGRL